MYILKSGYKINFVLGVTEKIRECDFEIPGVCDNR